jgi:hypothetical protein
VTQVWLALPAARWQRTSKEYFHLDADPGHRLEGLVAATGARWGAATAWRMSAASVVLAWRLLVPADAAATVSKVVRGLEERLGA